jgi:FlaG/FlaF family flagellin (archaellin)
LRFKFKSNKKGVSSVVAASIMLAAIVTVAVTFQAFIVPELDRESAFSHSQDVLYGFEQLYTEGKSTVPLSYSGTPFFSPATYTGQLSYVPSVGVNVTVTNATQLVPDERFYTESQNITVAGISDAYYYFTNVTENIAASCNFTSSQELLVATQISTQWLNNETDFMRLQLNVTANSELSSYNYSMFSGDSLELDLLSPIYNLTSRISNTSTVQFSTNSSSCTLFLNSLQPLTTNLTYTVCGALNYKSNGFPLAYIATPWGTTALEAGTSAMTSASHIYWTGDMLVLDLYNASSANFGTISGSESVGVEFRTYNSVFSNYTFSQMDLFFSFAGFNLNNSLIQLESVLRSAFSDDVSISHQEGADWLMITVEGAGVASVVVRETGVISG